MDQSFILAALTAGLGAYFGSYYKKKGESAATKEDIQEITRLAKSMEYSLKRQSDFADKILQRRLDLVMDINKKLDFLRYGYEKHRDNLPHELHINAGETLEATDLYRDLELNRATLGENFYFILRNKYDQVILLYDKNITPDWQKEMGTWADLSNQVQRLMEEEFHLSKARL